MKLEILKSIISKKENKSEFAIVTNLTTGESEIFEKNKPLSKELEKHTTQINNFFGSKKSGCSKFIGCLIGASILPSLLI